MCSRAKNPPPDEAAINRQIVEIKKKIQLSEGQRKALFEICEAERKYNADEILKLKKEISRLVLTLHESRNSAARYRMKTRQIENIIGPLGEKTCDEAKALLDLQIIDKSKQLNLLQYRKKKREDYLVKLAKEYETLLSEREKTLAIEKIEAPIKQTCQDLQNNIHAVEVQWREADHVRTRYKDIRKSLMEDSSRFESNIKQLEEELRIQQNDIDRLQEITEEAYKLRGVARNVLLKEEKLAQASANTRERQAADGQRLVVEKKQDLEKLERKIFQGGKVVTSRPETEATDEMNHYSPPPPHPVDILSEVFDKLKIVTGSTSVNEVLDRFGSQKETFNRLCHLRKAAESDKRKLERQIDKMAIELETHKYAEAKESELNSDQMESFLKGIEEQHNLKQAHVEKAEAVEKSVRSIMDGLVPILVEIKPKAPRNLNPEELLDMLESLLGNIMKRVNSLEEEKYKVTYLEANEDKWLPPPYNGLVRRTPIPQQGASPVPQPTSGSEEEEEIPSRGFLKRQAQLVVDAKSRRKNMRIQLPRLK